jgi:hypothetical protein
MIQYRFNTLYCDKQLEVVFEYEPAEAPCVVEGAFSPGSCEEIYLREVAYKNVNIIDFVSDDLIDCMYKAAENYLRSLNYEYQSFL